MKIHDDHFYHGAALIQIAEHKQFTAINALNLRGEKHRNAYLINDRIGVFLKYCVKPNRSYKEYTFTFSLDHLRSLEQIRSKVGVLFLVLVCVKGREICCLTYQEFSTFVEMRRAYKGEEENQYVLKITIPKGKSIRAYVDAPGQKKTILGDPIVVARNRFPNVLFE
jgi:hypothetical protein